MIKKFFKDLPKLPLSAFIFYLLVLILRAFGVIPPPVDIIASLEKLYSSYGLIILFAAVFLEGVVYFGLYFPGTTLVTISVLFSDGKFLSLVSIAVAAALALTMTSILNYSLGRRLSGKFSSENRQIKKTLSKGLIFSIVHPNTLSFYFFDSGLKKRSAMKILLVPFLIFVYGLILAFIITSFNSPFRAAVERPYILLCLIFLWIVIEYSYNKLKKKNFATP